MVRNQRETVRTPPRWPAQSENFSELETSCDFQQGDRVNDYVIEHFVASGGFGVVYRAVDSRNDRVVALKVLHAELRTIGDSLARFEREARILSLIEHPNVVRIFETGLTPDKRPFIAMELLSGCDLEEHLEKTGPLKPKSALELLEPICDALSAAHTHGVVHRDIKASNVFLDDSDERRVVLLDFGIAKVIEAGAVELSTSRMALGTPGSMAPEQIRGETTDLRADVYALGALTYLMLTGQQPFEGQSPALLQYMHLHGNRPRIAGLGHTGRAIDEVISRAMEREPNDRYASVADFMGALREAATARPSSKRARKQQQPAIGLYVDVRVCDDAVDDDVALDDTDALLDLAQELLDEKGLVPAFEGGASTLFVTLLNDERVTQQERRRVLLAAAEVHELLEKEPTSAELEINVCLHVDGIIAENDRFRGGDLMRIEKWAPSEHVAGVCATPTVYEGLDLETTPIDGSDLRVLAAIPRDKPVNEDRRKRQLHAEMMMQLGRQASAFIHDLRSPLAAVYCNLESVLANIQQGRPVSTDDFEALQDAMSAAIQLKETTSSVLEAASPQAYEDTRRMVRIRDVVDRAIKLSHSEVRRKAKVYVHHDRDGYVSGSSGRLAQVIVNLIVNAAQAIVDEGVIVIRTHISPSGKVVISVRDTGQGMSNDIQQHIFEPFYTTKDVVDGTGLGLASVREIVEQHGGAISVDSSVGIGSCFTVSLPSVEIDLESVEGTR